MFAFAYRIQPKRTNLVLSRILRSWCELGYIGNVRVNEVFFLSRTILTFEFYSQIFCSELVSLLTSNSHVVDSDRVMVSIIGLNVLQTHNKAIDVDILLNGKKR